MSFNRAEARAQIRSDIQDRIDTTDINLNPPSHLSRNEPAIPVTGSFDAVNKKFRVRHYPLLSKIVATVETLIQVTDQVGAAYIVDTVLTDYLRGIVALTAAPPTTTKKLLITYFSFWYTDDELNRTIEEAADFILEGGSGVTDDATNYPFADGLRPPFFAFARYKIFDALSTKTADFFDFSAGGKDEAKAEVPKMYQTKSEAAFDQAQTLRDAFYKRQGRQFVPAMGFVTPAQRGQPFTPPR